MLRMGIEVDVFGRPVAYWIRSRHPGELRLPPGESDHLERVPADQIIHLRVVDRWPQTRGEPWLHAVIRKLNDMDGYSEAEIVAARGAASYMGIRRPVEPETPDEDAEAAPEFELEPGAVQTLNPGEEFEFVSPNRPNPAMDPFMRMMLREVAAGIGVSYESLSRDYSQSNYSSSRLALLDDRDLWKVLQLWIIRAFRADLHEVWMKQAVYAGAIPSISVSQYLADPEKYSAVRFKPRGWMWIDPTKEVEAFKEAVRDGFTTVTDVIANTGGGDDIEDILSRRERELKLMKDKGLKFDTDPEVFDDKGALQATTEPASKVIPMQGTKR
jgi:lambda family phage portal protein